MTHLAACLQVREETCAQESHPPGAQDQGRERQSRRPRGENLGITRKQFWRFVLLERYFGEYYQNIEKKNVLANILEMF
jgi:hypothetical protein